MKKTPLLLASLVLAGCASAPKAPSQPPAQVTVYREPSPRDSLFPAVVSVDGQRLGALHPRQAFSFPLPPGEHRFSYELGVYSCEADVQVRSREVYVYKLSQGCVFELEESP